MQQFEPAASAGKLWVGGTDINKLIFPVVGAIDSLHGLIVTVRLCRASLSWGSPKVPIFLYRQLSVAPPYL